jgi:hypothetical protein
MMSPPAYHSYGGSIYQEEGQEYFQFQTILLGKTTWSPGFQDFLKALWKAFNLELKTDITRQALKDLMGEAYKDITLRTITNWFAKAKADLQMIVRERLNRSNTWETTFNKPFLARLPKHPPTQVGAAVPGGPKAAPSEPYKIDLKYAAFAVGRCKEHGWSVIEEAPGVLNLVAIDGMDQEVLDSDFKVQLREHKQSIIAFLRDPPQRE